MRELRDYQQNTINQIEARRTAGAPRVLAVLATGLGKTFTAVEFCRRDAQRVLWLAHRDELLDQGKEAFLASYGPLADVGKIAAKHNDIHNRIVVASVQTLRIPKRLEQLAATTPFDVIVIDETHHVRWHPEKPDETCSYRTIVDRLSPHLMGNPFVLGLTATPDRLDKRSVAGWYDNEIAVNYDTAWAIQNGYLKDLRAIRVETGIDLDAIKTKAGDYAEGDLGRALADNAVPAQMVEAWLAQAEGRSTIAFAPTVEVSKQLCEVFKANGIRAAHVDGTTPKDERRQTFTDLRSGAVTVVCNVGVATEGFDAPIVNCILLCRPTKSRGLYAQMVGRGLRLNPGDTNCLVIDIAGATKSNALIMAHDLLGLHRALDAHESGRDRIAGDAAAEAKAIEEADQQEQLDIETEFTSGTRLFYKDADAIGQARPSRHNWDHAPNGKVTDRFVCNALAELGAIGTLVVIRKSVDTEGHLTREWECGANTPTGPVLIHVGRLGKVIDAADRYIDKIVKAEAWRADPPSNAQLKELERRGIDHTKVEKLTRKMAGKMIDEAVRGIQEKAKKKTVELGKLRSILDDLTPELIEASWGQRAMVNPADIESLIGRTAPAEWRLELITRADAMMNVMCNRGILRRQGTSFVVLANNLVNA